MSAVSSALFPRALRSGPFHESGRVRRLFLGSAPSDYRVLAKSRTGSRNRPPLRGFVLRHFASRTHADPPGTGDAARSALPESPDADCPTPEPARCLAGCDARRHPPLSVPDRCRSAPPPTGCRRDGRADAGCAAAQPGSHVVYLRSNSPPPHCRPPCSGGGMPPFGPSFAGGYLPSSLPAGPSGPRKCVAVAGPYRSAGRTGQVWLTRGCRTGSSSPVSPSSSPRRNSSKSLGGT